MPIARDWEILPNSDLADRTNWRSLGDDRFAALRARLLIVRENGKQSRFGTVIAAHNVAPDDEITLRRNREQIISRTETISEAVRFTATSRVCDQLTAKVTAELSTLGPGFIGKVKTQLLTRSEYEITEQVENALNATTSYLIQEIEAAEHVITLKGGRCNRVAELRRRFWPRRWDVYLHSFEYLELSWRTRWMWWQVRKTIKQIHSGVVGWPLASLTFYEPQSDVDVCYDPVEHEIEAPDLVEVQSLDSKMPRLQPPAEEDLETLAKLAFPATGQEKTDAAKRRKKKAAVGVGKRRAGSLGRGKRRAGKRKTAGKSVGKKKTAKKRTAKRRTVKRRKKRKR